MDSEKAVDRHHKSFLANSEKKLLIAIARRLPHWITPDGLTALGILGSVFVFIGYVMTHISFHWIWLANLGLFLNWFGDSLDGTVARFRKIERPRYGFFLDHNSDVISMIFIAMGIGLSGFVKLETALLVLVCYEMLAIHTFIRCVVTGRMHVDAQGFGPTELRLGLIVLSIFFVTVEAPGYSVLGHALSLWDLCGLGVAVFLFGLFLSSFAIEAKKLKAEEHQKTSPSR